MNSSEICRRAERLWPAALVAAWLAASASSGCGPHMPETSPVAGTITVGGVPLASGRILFYPAGGRMAHGAIDHQGRYTLTTFRPGDGAVLGTHRVVIVATRVTGPPPPKTLEDELRGGIEAPPPGAGGGVEWLAPEIYSQADTTPLTAEVRRGGNTLNFALPAATQP